MYLIEKERNQKILFITFSYLLYYIFRVERKDSNDEVHIYLNRATMIQQICKARADKVKHQFQRAVNRPSTVVSRIRRHLSWLQSPAAAANLCG